MAATADCNISRCSHERRTFRKELQKWGRNVLLLVGLERIAEEVTGRRKWKKLMEPLNQLDSSISGDWKPDELCCFCNARKQPPPDPASGVITLDSVNGINGEENEINGITIKGEQPLDLSLAAKPIFANGIIPPFLSDHMKDEDDDDNLIKVPQLSSKNSNVKKSGISICTNLSKRSYTDEELQAALRDIQSGKLGTRRAAVIYGIPRSTLRNKVYKLTMGRGRSRQAYLKGIYATPGTKMKSENGGSEVRTYSKGLIVDDSKTKTVHSASESLRQLLKHRMAEKAAEIKAKSEHLDKFQLNGNDDTESVDSATNQGIAPLLSQVFANIHNIALSSHKTNNHANYEMNPLQGYNSEYPLVPLIPDLIHRLAEERIRIERERHQIKNEIVTVETKELSASVDNAASSSVILKIPSYKPSSKSADNVPSSQNNSGGDANDHSSTNGTKNGEGDEYDSECPSSSKKSKESRNKLCTSADSSSSEASNEKKSNSQTAKQKRPKRGRYRNYNRDSLIEAVRAVQRGEMSVHRAGSFYGVPHSTLEYKVKERHLLRPRKRDKLITIRPVVKQEESKTDKSENKINSKQNGLQAKPVVSPTQSVTANESGTMSLYSPLDFNQLAAANQFFASQMMRKLQEDAILHADEGKTSRDSSEHLFGDLIKNSLEQAYPTSVTPSANSAPVSLIATKTEAK